MNIGNLSAHQATDENLIGITRSSSCVEDRLALLVSPPAAVDALAGHSFGKIRPRSSTCFKHDAVLLNKLYWIHEE